MDVKSFLRQEKKFWRLGYRFVFGLDEAGRGAIAGPVFAAIVGLKFQIFEKFSHISQIMKINRKSQRILEVRDSKKLTKKKREEIFKIINSHPYIKYKVSRVSEKVIDKINIKNAAELAMLRCVQKLNIRAPFLIIDGGHINSKKLKEFPHKLIVKADEKVFSCALASIVAKVLRDKAMQKLSKAFPEYHFEKNKGYPTKEHLYLLKKHGPCRVYRRSFLPVKRVLNIPLENKS